MYEDLVEQRQVAPHEEPRSHVLLRRWIEVDWAEFRLPTGYEVRGYATASRKVACVALTSSYPAREREDAKEGIEEEGGWAAGRQGGRAAGWQGGRGRKRASSAASQMQMA